MDGLPGVCHRRDGVDWRLVGAQAGGAVVWAEPVFVMVGITNREQDGHLYRVEAWAQDGFDDSTRQLAGQAGSFDLKPGQGLDFRLDWSMPSAGEDQQVLPFLFMDNRTLPYRGLRLWVNVETAR